MKKTLRSSTLAPARVALGTAALLMATAGSDTSFGQQKAAIGAGGIPVAPTGLANRPLPKLPMEFDTGEGQRIRVTAYVTGLENPWTVAWLPDGSMKFLGK